MSFACIKGMFSAIGRPEVDAEQIGKKLPIPGARLMQEPDAAVNVMRNERAAGLLNSREM
jgi:hypothetical protein